MKNLFILFVLLLTLPCSGQEKDESKIHIKYEIYPSFPGGEAEMYKFIKKHLTYPLDAFNKRIEGRVVTRFLIRKTGDIDSIQVIRGIHPECDSVAVDIIKKMPQWEPGGIIGVSRKMDIWFTLPIVFKLPEPDTINGEKIYRVAEIMPQFPGGMDEMWRFIVANLKYPHQEMCVQGRVVVRFVVTKEGKIIKSEIVRGIEPMYFDKEALRVINIMPDWIPAKHKGEKVNAYFTLPVTFRLSDYTD